MSARHASVVAPTAGGTSLALRVLEAGLVPDALIRAGIRRELRARLRDERIGGSEAKALRHARLVADLRSSPIAIETLAANEQHYELPSAFFDAVLGPHAKYSCAYYALANPGAAAEIAGGATLGEAEEAMLELTCRRARLKDGERILELGCGWGSLSLYMAARFPKARIVAVSNSSSQRRTIEARARARGLANLEVLTCDANVLAFPPGTAFDRVVSVEMFEHMRNYQRLLGRIAGWLAPHGTLFVHIFAHRELAYPFEVRSDADWMARWFFTGGLMPSVGLLRHFQADLKLAEEWQVDGRHYERTANDWLANMDRNAEVIRPLLAGTYGAAEARRWWIRWRVFFMACAELFGYAGGNEWLVAHYLFEKPAAQ